MWGLYEIDLISQRENDASSEEFINGIRHKVPAHLDRGSGQPRLYWEVAVIVPLLYDLSFQLDWIFAITGRIAAAEVEGVDVAWTRERYFTLPDGSTVSRKMSLPLHFDSNLIVGVNASNRRC